MPRLERRSLLAGLSAMTLGACTGPLRIGEGKKPPKGGIGGTGIVGTLTDFGSLIVNGLRVETDAETVYTDAFGRVHAEALRIGQVLAIEAAQTGEGLASELFAKTVRISHPVIGPVQHVNPDGREGIVAGISVLLEDGAIGKLVPGTRVAISGIWQATKVIASRIDPVAPKGLAAIAGVVSAPDSTGGRVAGIAVRATQADFPEPGSFVTVVGMADSDGIVASKVDAGRFFGAAGPLTRLSVEGFLEPTAKAPFFAISGLGHSFDETARLARVGARRAIFTGGYEEAFAVSRAIILPDALAARRKLSAAIVNDNFRPSGLSTR